MTTTSNIFDLDNSKKQPLDPSLYSLKPEELAFIKKHTGINDEEELKKHIINAQAKAYDVYGYPCIRKFAFLNLRITRTPYYEDVLKLLENRKSEHPILLDIGCCFGNDIRKAVDDGWPVEDVIASDLEKGFWEAGHDLFKSTPETFPAAFVAGDAFDPSFLPQITPKSFISLQSANLTARPNLAELTSLGQLRGQLSAIHTSSFFHLFDEQKQEDLAKRLGALLIPKPGSMIFGQHAALPESGYRTRNLYGQSLKLFCYGPAGWENLWVDKVFGPAGIKVKVSTQLVETTQMRTDLEDKEQTWFIKFSVVIL